MIAFNGKDLQFACQVIHTACLMDIQGSVRRPNDPVYQEARKIAKSREASELDIQISEACAEWLRVYLK